MPYRAITTPPTSPPRAPTPRAPTDCSATAFIAARRGTASVTSACVAGISNDWPTPASAISANAAQRGSRPASAKIASSASSSARNAAAIPSSRWRGIRSLIAPASGAAISPGACRAANDAAVRNTESVSVRISQPTARRSVQMASAISTPAAHTRRKAGNRNAPGAALSRGMRTTASCGRTGQLG